MLPAHREIEKFLLTDLGLCLSNILAHLDWASSVSRDGQVILSKESVSSLSINQQGIERRASHLAASVRGRSPDARGVTETLEHFMEEAAA